MKNVVAGLLSVALPPLLAAEDLLAHHGDPSVQPSVSTT